MIRLAALLIIYFVYLPCGWAWGSTGHQLVCDIAWRNLTAESRDLVLQAVHKKGYKTYAQACNWADHIRSNPHYDDWKPQHYINQRRGAIALEVKHACAEHGCVVAAINSLTSRLRQHLNKSQTMSDAVAEQLLFLSHFIGDIHQPLHVSYADDRGGNNRRVTLMNREEATLHRVWDELLLTYRQEQSWRKRGKKLNAAISPLDRQRWLRNNTAEDWGNESFQLTRQIYAETAANIDTAYCQRFYPVVEEQIQKAGIRLADHLNRLVGKPSALASPF